VKALLVKQAFWGTSKGTSKGNEGSLRMEMNKNLCMRLQIEGSSYFTLF